MSSSSMDLFIIVDVSLEKNLSFCFMESLFLRCEWVECIVVGEENV